MYHHGREEDQMILLKNGGGKVVAVRVEVWTVKREK